MSLAELTKQYDDAVELSKKTYVAMMNYLGSTEAIRLRTENENANKLRRELKIKIRGVL